MPKAYNRMRKAYNCMFTPNQLAILNIFFLHPDREFYVRELGRILSKQPGVFQKTLASLEQNAILISHRRGNQKLFKLNEKYPMLAELRGIVQKTSGIETRLAAIVKKINGLKLAILFGSYVKGGLRKSSDIDILLVGDPKCEDIILRKLTAIEKELVREINYKFYSETEFRKKEKSDPFILEILSDKYQILKGSL